jgi:hypothetical protein
MMRSGKRDADVGLRWREDGEAMILVGAEVGVRMKVTVRGINMMRSGKRGGDVVARSKSINDQPHTKTSRIASGH